MKNHIKTLILGIAVFMCTSCGAFANMSPQDAYDIGWGIGRAASYLIDN